MLITAKRGFTENPFSARIDIGNYVAVAWAADDATDARIREMEPPTHESIEYKRIGESDRRQKIREQLQAVSDKIRDYIKEKLDFETFEQKTELRELSNIIPYVSDPDEDNANDDDPTSSQRNQTIGARKIQTGKGIMQAGGLEETDDDDDDDDAKKRGQGGGSGGPPEEPTPPKMKKVVSNMRNVRVVRHGGGALRVAFDTKTGASKFVIKPAGEEYKDEPPITVRSAAAVSGAKSAEVQDKNVIRTNAEPGSRVVLDVSPGRLSEYTGYTILEFRARRTAK